MSHACERITGYPIVTDSMQKVSDAYSWVSSGERFQSIFQLSEQAVNMFKDKAKSLASTGSYIF